VRAGGPGSFHGDVLRHVGAENAVPDSLVYYPDISAEGLWRIDPDVIVVFEPGAPSAEAVRAEWTTHAPSLKAVRSGRVLVFIQDYLSIPGPRLVRFLEDLARALHPEAPWPQN
jgi:iron complex transport system substrate-binding protein